MAIPPIENRGMPPIAFSAGIPLCLCPATLDEAMVRPRSWRSNDGCWLAVEARGLQPVIAAFSSVNSTGASSVVVAAVREHPPATFRLRRRPRRVVRPAYGLRDKQIAGRCVLVKTSCSTRPSGSASS